MGATCRVAILSAPDTDHTFYGSSTSAYLTWDASANLLYSTGVDLQLKDSDYLVFGTGAGASGDANITWDGTNLVMSAVADDSLWEIGDSGTTQKSFDLKWYAGENSGASYLYADASANLLYTTGVDLQFKDSDYLVFGTGSGATGDVQVAWDGTDLDFTATADNSIITFGTATASFDLKFWSGVSTTYTYFDSDGDTNNGSWSFGLNDYGVDVYMYGATAGSYVLYDQSANSVTHVAYDIHLADDTFLRFGGSAAAGDVTIAWDTSGTNLLYMLPAADDTKWYIGNGTYSFDVSVFGNTSNAELLWDASADTLALLGPARPKGFNALAPSRYELRWVAGQRGKPALNADIQDAAEATRMIADPDFEVLGTNASSDDVTFYVEGGIVLETDGADHDQVILLPHLDANQSAWTQVTWGTDQETAWECDIKTGAAITNAVIWAGLKLTNTSVTATDDNQAFFRYQAGVNDGEWQAISSISGVDDEHDTGVVVATGTAYHLKIVIGSDRTAKFYINGALVETSAALADTIDLIPYIGVQSEGAAEAKVLYVRGQAISRNM